MIDIDALEALAKAATSGLPGDRITFALHAMDPEGMLALIAEVRALREESARLNFMLENDAFTVQCNRDGSILQYQLMTQDEDENYHVLHDEHRFYNTERDAIDAARGEK
jgi:hypothetical protein